MTTPWIVAFVALAALVILVGLLLLGLLRRITPLLEESQELIGSASRRLTIGGLPPGATVPAFAAEEVGGGVFTQDDLRGEPSVVLFLDDGCAACEGLVADLRSGYAPVLGARLVVITSSRETAAQMNASARIRVIVDEGSVAQAFESVVSPQAFVVDEHGLVRTSGTPNAWDELRQLVDSTKGGGHRLNVTAASVASSNVKEVV